MDGRGTEIEQNGKTTGWAVPRENGRLVRRWEGTGAAETQERGQEGKSTGWAVPEESGAAVMQGGGSGAAVMHK